MTPEERDLLAGEFALGLPEGAERAEALRLVLADRDFAAAVAEWRERFAALFAEWPEATPGPALEARILAALPGRASAGAPGSRALGIWRAVAGASSLAAAALLAALVLRPEPTPRIVRVPAAVAPAPVAAPAPLLAALTPTPDEDATPLAALVDRETGVITLAGTIDVPAGRVAQLWTIGADGNPRSLGLLADGETRLTVTVQGRGRLAPTVVLAISIEPPGGSPTGNPTGPVIATGPLTTA